MAICELCGNDYDKAFQVIRSDGTKHVFDSIECAAQVIAPTCDHCGCRILGHGFEISARFFCCDHCARAEGIEGFEDRVREERRVTT